MNGADKCSIERLLQLLPNGARKISAAGGSMRDVQSLARHSSLTNIRRYIEVSEDAMRKVVG